MIFVLRQIQEKCREQNMGLYAAFINLTKAFDTVSRDGLWKILSRLCCPPKLLATLQQLHEGQVGQVKHGGGLSDPFPISNGVKQGCVLALTLSAILLSVMLREAKENRGTTYTNSDQGRASSINFASCEWFTSYQWCFVLCLFYMQKRRICNW